MLLVLALLGAAGIQAGEPRESNFTATPESAALAGWRLTGGRYQVQDGWLTVVSETSNPEATWKDARLDGDGTFRATVRNARHCHRTILEAKGVYRLEINNQFRELQLQRRTGQSWRVVARAPNYEREALADDAFELRLAFRGRQVMGFLDDRALVRFEDPDPVPDGATFGFGGGWGTDVAWRDFRLSPVVDDTSAPLLDRPPRADEKLVQVTWVRGLSPDSISFDGETNGLRCRLTTALAQPVDARLHVALVDVRGRTLQQLDQTVTLRRGTETERTLSFLPPARGCFKVVLSAAAGTNDLRWVEDLGSFTVLSRALYERPRLTNSFFGGHMDGINLEWHLAAGRKLGIQWARCHDMLQHTWWNRVQPDGPNAWKWSDPVQQQIDAQGFATLGEFLWTPKWAGPKPQGAPSSYDTFATYVAETVGHYRGSIHYWEVWNEPHFSGFWQGTPEEYARLLGVAYRAAKQADPHCVVIGGGGVDAGNTRWIVSMLRALEGRPLDAFSVHYLATDEAGVHMERLRRLLQERNLAVPVWNTEASVWSASFLDQVRPDKLPSTARYTSLHACSELVRMYLANLSHGVERVFYYNQADPWRFQSFPKPRTTATGLLNPDMWDEGRMLKPMAAAHAALAGAIDGKRFMGEVRADLAHAFLFAGPDEAVVVQYASGRNRDEPRILRLPLPAGATARSFTAFDMMGNELPAAGAQGTLVLPFGPEPVYLVCRGANAADLLRAAYRSDIDRQGGPRRCVVGPGLSRRPCAHKPRSA